jgi:alkylation response protein AidB-like acyl-CoA dehydrogenase
VTQRVAENLRPLVAAAAAVGEQVAGPLAARTDSEARWPAEAMAALAESGLLGLHVPVRFGGHGQGLTALAYVCETLAGHCASTAMCFGMHSVATAVIAAKATPDQEERYLRPIALGRHLTTLALSETATGAHFYYPRTTAERRADGYVVTGEKAFVTSGGQADSYVLSMQAGEAQTGEFSCAIADRDAGLHWGEDWRGLGMRGNSSRRMRLDQVTLPHCNLLGSEGDQVWYVFEVIAPFFIMAMAGTYLGVASAAVDIAIQHLRGRVLASTGEALAHADALQQRVAEMWLDVERTRCLVREAARAGDEGDAAALPLILSAKIAAADTAVAATNAAMSACGGIAYREDDRLARLLRDARAAPVMSPTTELLKLWAGRTLLGLPIL